jgi:hypothetical protein
MLYCYIGCFVLSWGALSTYWDVVFGHDDFYAHGLGVGLALLPLVFIGVSVWLILLRAVCLAVSMGIWSNLIDTDWLEEGGRGVLIILTLPILAL